MFGFIKKQIIKGIIKDVTKALPDLRAKALTYFNEHKEELVEKLVDFVKKEILKEIAIITGIVMLVSLPVIAKEPEQAVENNQAYVTANIQKQPAKDNKQKIGNHFSFFVVNIQINGKIKDIDTAEDVR